MLLDFRDCMRAEAHFLNILGTSESRAKHELYFIISCLARVYFVPRMFKKMRLWYFPAAAHKNCSKVFVLLMESDFLNVYAGLKLVRIRTVVALHSTVLKKHIILNVPNTRLRLPEWMDVVVVVVVFCVAGKQSNKLRWPIVGLTQLVLFYWKITKNYGEFHLPPKTSRLRQLLKLK